MPQARGQGAFRRATRSSTVATLRFTLTRIGTTTTCQHPGEPPCLYSSLSLSLSPCLLSLCLPLSTPKFYMQSLSPFFSLPSPSIPFSLHLSFPHPLYVSVSVSLPLDLYCTPLQSLTASSSASQFSSHSFPLLCHSVPHPLCLSFSLPNLPSSVSVSLSISLSRTLYHRRPAPANLSPLKSENLHPSCPTRTSLRRNPQLLYLCLSNFTLFLSLAPLLLSPAISVRLSFPLRRPLSLRLSTSLCSLLSMRGSPTTCPIKF